MALIGSSRTIGATLSFIRRPAINVVDLRQPWGRGSPSQPLTPSAAAAVAAHVGGRPRFVHEHKPHRIEIELPVKLGLSLAQDVGAAVLGRVSGFLP